MPHKCVVTLDSREGKLAPLIAEFEDFEVKAMPAGDIAFTVDGKLVAIGERKEVNDMVSSVFDGRYMLQRANLIERRKEQPGLLVFYLIEGDIYRDIEWGRFASLRPDALKAIWNENTMLYGLFNIFTEDLMATLGWISMTQEHYIRHGDPEHNVLASNPARYAKIKKSKDVKDVKLNMLRAIDGVTFETAGQIFKEYRSMNRLMRAYKQLRSEDERCKMLADLLRSDEPKARRIGPALSEKVYRSLFSVPAGDTLEAAEGKAVQKAPEPAKETSPAPAKKKRAKKQSTEKPPPSKRKVLRDESPKRKSELVIID
jgi:ERCC4-type nuclease